MWRMHRGRPAQDTVSMWERMLKMAGDYSPEMARSVLREFEKRGVQVPPSVRQVLEARAALREPREEGSGGQV